MWCLAPPAKMKFKFLFNFDQLMRISQRPRADSVDGKKSAKRSGKIRWRKVLFFVEFFPDRFDFGSPRMLVSGRYFFEKSNDEISTQIFERSHYSFVQIITFFLLKWKQKQKIETPLGWVTIIICGSRICLLCYSNITCCDTWLSQS